MNICLRCFEMKEMFHGRDCKQCRTKYLHYKWLEKNRKICPICKCEHNFRSSECSSKCKILNRHKIVNGCWEWQGKISKDGYGSFQEIVNSEKIEIRAHRKSYEIFKGIIPEGLQVCHSCDNPCCCNPEHLWVGTQKENMQDCIKKGRFLNANKRAIAAGKMTQEKVIELREMHQKGISQKELQKIFAISQSQVSGIIRYKFWNHIE